MTEYGPFQNEREALATRAAAALRAACDANPRGWQAEHLKVMTEACEAIGVPLGAFDVAPFRQLAMYEAFNAVVIAGIIHRAFEAGKVAGPDGAVTEWGARYRDGDGSLSRVMDCGQGAEGERTARSLSGASRKDDLTGIVLRREVGPWKEAPEGETG